jgi:hypothetical protein
MRSEKKTASTALVVLLVAMVGLQRAIVGGPTTNASFYATQRWHLWNRIHETLIVRRSADGRRFGNQDLDPLLWTDSDHLLKGVSGERARRSLDEFLTRDHDRLIQDPIKRAVLQHKLWGIFDWLADAHVDPLSERRQNLRWRIALLIRRLALTSDEIDNLPDNYAAVVASGQFPGAIAHGTCDQAYLPKRIAISRA